MDKIKEINIEKDVLWERIRELELKLSNFEGWLKGYNIYKNDLYINEIIKRFHEFFNDEGKQ